jgi:hypothetical protein
MSRKFISGFTVVTLTLAGALSAVAQTTQEGPAPSDQPGAPMEIGQPQAQSPVPPPQAGQPTETNIPPGGPQAAPGQPPQPGDQQPGEPPQMGEAQPGGPSGEGPAKVDQGVGRISMIHGEVSTQRGDSGTWSAAVLNQPVLNGDKVSTGAAGRAEVQLDYANILRLAPNAQANIANFTHKYIQIQLGQGLANYTVFGESQAEPEIDTPNVSVHPAHQDGVYRIEVRPDGDSIVIVRKGSAQISTPQGIADIKQGEMATVRGSGGDARYKIGPAPDRDDWDRFNAERDRMIHSANSWRHTNRYYTGSEDLDAYGRWQNVPDYGDVWVPNEPSDWTPYRDGNWVWEPYYGWTWVGYEPWGWAPYHYGRWFWYGSSWAWWPGPVWGWYRPFWAPAYVSFFGWGGGFGFGFGFGWGGWGGFGWLPIGPGDRFFPWWGGYGGRFGYVGFNRFGTLGRFGGFEPLHAGTRFSNLAHMSDPHIGGALSTVAAGKFGTRTSAVAATHAQLSGARMMTGNVPAVPSRASLSASGRAAAPSTIHSGAATHFAGTQSAAHTPSFQQQTARLQQSMQQNHISSPSAGGRETASESRSASASGKPSAGTPASRSESAAGERSQTSSAGRTESGSASRAESASAGHSEADRSGWKSFTPPSHSNESASRGESAGRESGAQSANRGESGSYWNRTAPSSSSSRGSSSSSYGRGSSGSYSRPQLSMRQPIAQPRSSGGYGGYRGAPSYGGGYGGYGGSRSTPSYGGSRGGYSGGGSHSAPSSGGHSSGGGHASSGGHSGGGHR